MVKKIFYALVAMPLIFGCDNDEGDCCKTIEAVMFFDVTNSEDLDLLDPNSGGIDTNLIEILYTNQDEEMVLVNNSQLDGSKGYVIIEPDAAGNPYRIKVFLNIDYIESNVSYTHIKWSSDNMDEIKTEFDLSNNNIIAKKIWVNGELKWESSSSELLISLVK